MSDVDDFLAEIHPRLVAELQALHNGDPKPRLAYTVELEHTSVSLDGVPVAPYTLRVTQVYRREDGQWKVVHRHGDQISIDQSRSLPGEASTA